MGVPIKSAMRNSPGPRPPQESFPNIKTGGSSNSSHSPMSIIQPKKSALKARKVVDRVSLESELQLCDEASFSGDGSNSENQLGTASVGSYQNTKEAEKYIRRSALIRRIFILMTIIATTILALAVHFVLKRYMVAAFVSEVRRRVH